MPEYGSPNLNDPTAQIEKIVNDTAEWFNRTVREIGPQLLNRPIGSVTVKPEDELADFAKVYRDPAALQQIHAQRRQQMGARQGDVDFVRWYNKNRKRIMQDALP